MNNGNKRFQTGFYFVQAYFGLSLLFILLGCETKARRFEGELYPPLTDAVKSGEYQVWLNGNPVFVEKLNRFDVPVHIAKAAFEEQQKVKIDISVNGKIISYAISPLRKKIPATIKGNTLSFILNKPEYLVVKINEQDYLFLLFDAPIKDKPQASDKKVKNVLDYQIDNTGEHDVTKQLQAAIDEASLNKGILYFPKGTYKTSQLNVKSNVTLFLEPGAQIKAIADAHPGKALLEMDGAENIRILGHGTIDGSGTELRRNGMSGIYLLQISGAKNIEIDGTMLRNSCFWNTRVYQSTGVHLKNIKVLNNRPVENWNNTDGVDFDSSIDCSLENAFLYCGDDNMVVKGLDDKRQYNTENIRFEKIITLSNSAAAKIGTETCVRLFNQITFKDIDVIQCKRAMAIDALDSATVKNIVFENITIESFNYNGTGVPYLMDFEITDNSWRPCTGNCRIEHVMVKNVDVLCDIQQVKTKILGRTPQYSIHDLLIDGLKVKGKPVETQSDINMVTNNNVFGLMLKTNKDKYIESGTVWKDTDGNVINAHGGGMLYYNGTYYWYGENKGDSTYRLEWVKSWDCWRTEAGGVSCYSSKDLVNWKFEGLALPSVPDDTLSDLHPSQVIERPKVIYNDKTEKFVMWMHIESPDYEKAHAGVAISDTPEGPFTYLGSFKPNGQDSRDQTLFKDDDGRAYHICSSEWNKTLHISLLNDEYTRESGIYTRNFINKSREAPAVFKHENKYYMITSDCTGWDPNVAEYAVADSMLGNWTTIGNPCTGKNADNTFYAQSAFVFPVEDTKDCYIAMFDRWNKTDLINSRYVWLPVEFNGKRINIKWQDKWQVKRIN